MMAHITITAFLADALNHSGADGNGAPAAKKQEKGCRKKEMGIFLKNQPFPFFRSADSDNNHCTPRNAHNFFAAPPHFVLINKRSIACIAFAPLFSAAENHP